MDIQDQTKPATHSGHICHRCGWPFPNSHPSSKHRRAHNKICGTIEGYTNTNNKLIHSQTLSDDDDQHHSDDQEKTPSPKIEKRIIKESGTGGTEERSNYSEDLFSDAKTEFSDTLLSPGVQERFLVNMNSSGNSPIEVFKTPDSHIKDADKTGKNVHNSTDTQINSDTKAYSEGSHKDDFIDRMDFTSKHVDAFEVIDNKDQEKEDVYELSVASDIPIVDHAETLIDDFKDHKTIYSNSPHGDKIDEIRSIMDNFEVKTAEETIQESQTSETGVVNEQISQEVIKKAAIDDSVPVLTEVNQPESGIEAKQKLMENLNVNSEDSGKVVISESLEKAEESVFVTVVDEGGGKLLTSQDCGVDASVDSSSRNSLEGNWGSVSVLSTASIDAENAHSIGKSEISSDKSRLGKSDAFEGPSFVVPKEKIEELKASEIKSDTIQNSQPPKSEANTSTETEGRKRNEEAIAKVTNWTTNENPVSEAKSFNPKQLSAMIKKDEAAEKSNEPKKSNLVNLESSTPKDIGDSKKVEKKSKRSWVPFPCCSFSK